MAYDDSPARPHATGFRRIANAIAPHPVLVFFSAVLVTVCVITVLGVYAQGVFAVLSIILGVVSIWYASTFSRGRLARGPLYGAYTSERDRRRALLLYEAMCVGLLLFGTWAIVDSQVTQNGSFIVVHGALFGGSTYWGIFYLWGEVISPRRQPLPAHE